MFDRLRCLIFGHVPGPRTYFGGAFRCEREGCGWVGADLGDGFGDPSAGYVNPLRITFDRTRGGEVERRLW